MSGKRRKALARRFKERLGRAPAGWEARLVRRAYTRRRSTRLPILELASIVGVK